VEAGNDDRQKVERDKELAAIEPAEIDLRQAINAISDVVQNRPAPLREFDQIFMKAGDMVLQSD
jgi:N4-bis(aminopropyl)spermidine synthase